MPRQKQDTRRQSGLDISVVFATRDRDTQLQQTLQAYRRLNTDGIRWELIVVDNNSCDGTARVLEANARHLPLIRLFTAEGGQNRARNSALNHIHGNLVLFTDDDALPREDCLQAYLAGARRWPDEAIFGARIEPRFPADTPDWIKDPSFGFASTAFARYAPAQREQRVARHPYGPSFAIRRHALGKHRFPAHLGPQNGAYAMGGEGHLLRRLRTEGWSFIYVPSARVEHVIRPDQVTPRWLIQRANRKGRGQVHLPSNKRPRKMFWHGIPLRLWLAATRSAVRYYGSSPFVSVRRRTLNGIKYALRNGEIQERLRLQQHPTSEVGRPAYTPHAHTLRHHREISSSND